FNEKHAKGDKITGLVRSITDFGLFIGLEGGIDGLVHVSDISWTLSGEAAIRDYKKGQEVEAIIISVDVEKERIALGIKQLDNDPFGVYTLSNDKGSIVKGTVKSVTATEAILELAPEIEATLSAREASTDKVDDLTNVVKIGDELEVLITSVDKKHRAISVSVRAVEKASEAEAMKKVKNAEKASGTTSLGALLQDKFGSE
ncbi:MAG TPA: S1 RNA-binding domain-containing protein, partial [Aquella sp.]|nr:S1 RNA-binding domain-containing protein [Aquella sp.]